MAPPLLTLKDIHVSFGSTPLLAGADLDVAAGDRICLVGRNGSGKSTLLKIAAGLAVPDRGERFIHPNAAVRYLAQEPSFDGYATVHDYVVAGLPPTSAAHEADSLIETLGLDPAADPRSISGGEARRAALARPVTASGTCCSAINASTDDKDAAPDAAAMALGSAELSSEKPPMPPTSSGGQARSPSKQCGYFLPRSLCGRPSNRISWSQPSPKSYS